ncbi:26S protease regulatory subunit-like protein [Dinothrombium tinctorium]|uniref:26S protease regulatory subunit-like protein n=1 Tax=Dinothrombium tinctorium TaxID=1965070 RepID=A0A3S3QB12_9ACAR|nr:26S protease regulatory subunit-like protein [Dinothrombium tinctorium]RWS17051.1 26S protease regulatory subunit-like protein [Dinothrombium tinctorium]RWS17053.1 26S protease regulatory subunit-like protein [Dinothrombium tinctorium]
MATNAREKAIQDYRKKLLEHREIESRLKEVREQLKEVNKQYEKSENDLKALQSMGQIVGEVLKQLTEDKFIVKATNGPRYVVGCRRQLDKSKLKPGTRVALDMTTLTIVRYLPREVDPLHGEIDWEGIVKLTDGFNGADLRNVCTEAGVFAIRADREYVIEEDFMKAARKISDNKKLETKLDYKPV